jgi:DNA-binding beta-propeller fold protein YncE
MLAIGLGLATTTLAAGGGNPPLERVATIQSKGPNGSLDHLFVEATGSRLFLANQVNNTLDIIDLTSNKLVKQLPEQKSARSVVVAPELDRIFVGNGGGTCNVFDAKDYRLLKSIPVKGADSVRYDPRTKHVFVASAKSLTVIDAKSFDVLATIALPGAPHAFQVAGSKPRLYMNSGPPAEVTVIDTDTNKVVDHYKFQADKGIASLALDEAGKRIFVGLRDKARLAVLNMESGKELASVPLPAGVDDMFYDSKDKRIYASCGAGSIAVIRQLDADHYEPLATIATVKGAKTSFYHAPSQRLFVAVPRQGGKEGPEIWVYQARR